MKPTKDIVIAGAGLVGSLLSIYLAKKGHSVRVFERRADSRKASIYQGRSINLALSNRGWRALEGVGVAEDIKRISIPMYRRVMHDAKGNLSYQPYGKDGEAIYSVSRALLNQKLLDIAEEMPKVSLQFERKCVGVDLEAAKLELEDPNGLRTEVQADFVFGSDGAFSAVRSAMERTDRFNYQQEYIEHGYKELSIPAGPDGSFLMEKEALHIWPRGDYMLIALPNPDGTFTCTLFFPYEGNPSFSSLKTLAEARTFFEEVFPDALALMPDFDEEWTHNPNSSLCIIRCYPWVKGKMALIGDAAHAIVPFYGQGMNSGFEDCRILDMILDEEDTWERAMERYQRERKGNGDAIAELAMRNFIEMRDLTADKEFLLRKRIEAKVAEKHPQTWLPLYSMVTFSHIPYERALQIGKIQDKIMKEVMNRSDIEEMWDSPEVEAAIIEAVQRYL